MDPSIEPSWLSKAVDWVSVALAGLVGIVYKNTEKKLDGLDAKIDHEVRCARLEMKGKADSDDIKTALGHIDTLFKNAETDRRDTRNMIDTKAEKLNDTIQINQREVMNAIADIKQRCLTGGK